MSTQETREMWDAQAATFDDEPDHGLADPATRAAWRDLLLEHLPAAPARVADLGCGTGSLSVLLAEQGYDVHGVDLAGEMVARARMKAEAAGVAATFTEGDAAAPPLPAGAFDAVLSRHVLWALPDPAAGLARWCDLLAPGGRLVLVEGFWFTGAGLSARDTEALVRAAGRTAVVHPLTDPVLWGREVDDERYLVLSTSAA
jgi:SAM-dependent methyltransferase